MPHFREREFILILFRIDPGQRPGADGRVVILSQWRRICASVEPRYHKTQSGLSVTLLVFVLEGIALFRKIIGQRSR